MPAPTDIVPGLVSVVIPTYNRASLLVEAIRSAQAQTHRQIEIIVADDGSTDDTAARVLEFPGVQFHSQKNSGPSAARNLGLKFCRGEFVAFLDSDDLWSPEFLAESLRGLAATGAGLVFANWREVDANGNVACPDKFATRSYLTEISANETQGWHTLTPQWSRELFIRHSATPPTGVVLRRSCISPDGWDTQARVGEDRLFFLDALFASGCAVAFTRRVLWTFRIHGANTHAGNAQLGTVAAADIYSKQQILAKHGAKLTTEQKRILCHALAADYFDWGWHESRQGERRAAWKCFSKSFQLHPRVKLLLAAVKALLR